MPICSRHRWPRAGSTLRSTWAFAVWQSHYLLWSNVTHFSIIWKGTQLIFLKLCSSYIIVVFNSGCKRAFQNTADPHCELSICQFVCSLKCICNPQINTHGAFVVIHGHAEQRKCQVARGAHFSQLRLDKWCSIISVQLLLQTSVLFLVCLVPGFFTLVIFFWWFHCLWCHHAECHLAAWCSWRKKALKCFAEKICVLDELCSGLRYSDCWPWVQCQGINNMY